ncbi:ubiquitin carboxyl-terminal hydrolase 37-like [Neocloeon triangulifer]|uniref:ubiquitin carboxyl-terminal hydrolase 37-like n=1 Tax=Neocloeon triangulifer TaxID=2078957 RepID=UPI00286EFA04|nr:ubiquitin carboxyl-terminal hydrolase 37-like [Neocloeon triangulifer]
MPGLGQFQFMPKQSVFRSSENQTRVKPLLESNVPSANKVGRHVLGNPSPIMKREPNFSSRGQQMISALSESKKKITISTREDFYDPVGKPLEKISTDRPFAHLPAISVTVVSPPKRNQSSCGRQLEFERPQAQKVSKSFFSDDEEMPLAKKFKGDDQKQHMTEPHLIGFRNQGATCYMNSVLQVLTGLEQFYADVLEELPMMSSQLCPLQSLFRARDAGNVDLVYLCLKELHSRFAYEVNKSFQNNFEQQDLDEFMTFYLEKIDSQILQKRKELEYANPSPTLVEKNFTLKEVERRVCSKCQNEVSSKQCNNLFRVSLTQDHVNASHTNKMSVQDLVESTLNGPWDECCSCRENNSVRTLKKLTSLPRTLLVILMRYNNQGQKLETPVTISPYLNLENYISADCSAPIQSFVCKKSSLQEFESVAVQTDPEMIEIENPDTPETDNEDSALKEALSASLREQQPLDEEEEIKRAMAESLAESDPFKRKPCSNVVYKLKAVVSHYGDTPHSGHYKCDVFRSEKSKWYNYNDICVEDKTTIEVLQGGEENCYLLVYDFDGDSNAINNRSIKCEKSDDISCEDPFDEKENTQFDESANSFVGGKIGEI